MNEYLIITTEGHKLYYKDADCTILHREEGPAIEFTQGHKSWYQNNLRHREDGPAIMSQLNGNKWFLNGKEVTKEEHAQLTQAINKEIFNDRAGIEVW